MVIFIHDTGLMTAERSWLCWLTSEAGRILKTGNKWCIPREINENEKFTAHLYLVSLCFIPMHHIA